jgi:hypothetical protein
MMEAIYLLEPLVPTFNIVQCHNPEDHNSTVKMEVMYS